MIVFPESTLLIEGAPSNYIVLRVMTLPWREYRMGTASYAWNPFMTDLRSLSSPRSNPNSFLHGTPYKYQKTIRTHTKFVQAVEYASDDSLFASAGSDGKLFLYDGSTGDQVGELGGSEAEASEKHAGTIFALAWSRLNPSKLASFAADGRVRLWDAGKQQLVKLSFTISHSFSSVTKKNTCLISVSCTDLHRCWTLAESPSPEQQQVGGTWVEGHRLCSLSYNGDMTILDEREAKPVKIICVGFYLLIDPGV